MSSGDLGSGPVRHWALLPTISGTATVSRHTTGSASAWAWAWARPRHSWVVVVALLPPDVDLRPALLTMKTTARVLLVSVV